MRCRSSNRGTSTNDLSKPEKYWGELRETHKIYNTRVAECRVDNVARESTRTRCLNSAIYQTLLSSEPFHVAINVSTAGTSYFKALWHRHAHAKFASRRRRSLHITLPPRALPLYRTDPAIYRLCHSVTASS